MKRKEKLTLVNICAYCLIAITALVVLLSTNDSLGWLANNKDIDANSVMFKIEESSSISVSPCYVLKYDGIEGASSTTITDAGVYIEMSEYDMVFTDRNVNTPLIIRSIVSGLTDEQWADEDGVFTISIDCTGKYKDTYEGKQNIIQPYLSNVVQIKAGVGLGTTNYLDEYGEFVTPENKEILYTESVAALKINAIDTKQFVDSGAKEMTITLTLTHDEIASHIQQGTENKYFVLIIEIDYVNSLVDDYHDSYEGNSLVLEENLSSDFSTFAVKWSGGTK